MHSHDHIPHGNSPISLQSFLLLAIRLRAIDAAIFGLFRGLCGDEFAPFLLHHVLETLELLDVKSLKTNQFLPSDQSNFFSGVHTGGFQLVLLK